MGIVTTLAPLFLLALGASVVWFRRKSRQPGRRIRHRNVPLPILIIPTSPGASDILPAGVVRDLPPIAAQPFGHDEPVEQPAAEPMVHAAAAPQSAVQTAHIEREKDLETWTEPARARTEAQETAPDATVMFKRPGKVPVQVLPGRLHVLSGESAGRDLHLLAKVGERPRILVGRDAGPAHRHITLRSPTVSRRHARIEFNDGQWTITNLSETNPVLVNDRALDTGSSARPLSNGDRIELGEVALRFLAS